MITHTLSIVFVFIAVIDLVRLFRFGNAGGLGALISRPLLGIVTTKMFRGLIIWITELFLGFWGGFQIWHWIF